MNRDIAKLQSTIYDLLIIGGGINGASIAHLAAKAGLKTALIEKGDFASGTSSKSTKLIHGGLRYLENFEIDLVYESLKERKIQLQAAPHLVKPLEFLIPVYRGDKRPLWMMRFGVFLYDLIAGPFRIAPHRFLTKAQVLETEPRLKVEGLIGGVTYYDAQMDDARLCLENVLSAAEAGAEIANYVVASEFIKEHGRVTGVRAIDLLTQKSFEVQAEKIIVAGGPWTNKLLKLDDALAKKKVRTTKGIHLVYQDRLADRALFVPSQRDQRIFFIIPWFGHSLIGTTDTDFIGDPDEVRVEQTDIDYLMTETRRVFPQLDVRPEKILSTFAGLRPLIRKGGSANKVSRKHLFHQTKSGLIYVVGGKYTTYRAVAEDCLKRTFKGYEAPKPFTLYGGEEISESPETVAKDNGLEKKEVEQLMNLYGSRYSDVLALIKKDPSLKEKINQEPAVLKAQIVYSVKAEMARTPEDIFSRRIPLSYLGPVPKKCKEAAQEILSKS